MTVTAWEKAPRVGWGHRVLLGLMEDLGGSDVKARAETLAYPVSEDNQEHLVVRVRGVSLGVKERRGPPSTRRSAGGSRVNWGPWVLRAPLETWADPGEMDCLGSLDSLGLLLMSMATEPSEREVSQGSRGPKVARVNQERMGLATRVPSVPAGCQATRASPGYQGNLVYLALQG